MECLPKEPRCEAGWTQPLLKCTTHLLMFPVVVKPDVVGIVFASIFVDFGEHLPSGLKNSIIIVLLLGYLVDSDVHACMLPGGLPRGR